MAADGLVEAHTSHTGKKKRTVYSITEEGTNTLRDWLGTPVSPFGMDFEAMIRLFVATLGSTEQLVATLQQVRSDTRDLLRFAGEVKKEFLEGRTAFQDQIYIRALAVDFFISLFNTVESWTERTLTEVLKWEGTSIEDRNRRGLGIFKGLPVQVPEQQSTKTPIPPSTLTRPRR